MKALVFAIFTLLAASPPMLALATAEGFETDHVVFYLPEEVMEARISSVADFVSYTKQLQAICAEFFATTKTPETLHIVVAVRPGKRARVWFVSSTRSAPDTQREPLRKKLEAIPPFDVHDGPIAFAISAKLAGGDGKTPTEGKDFKTPIPKAWQDAVTATGKGRVLVDDSLFDLIWPNKG